MMKTIFAVVLLVVLGGCGSMLPEQSGTKLEKSPCACDQGEWRNV